MCSVLLYTGCTGCITRIVPLLVPLLLLVAVPLPAAVIVTISPPFVVADDTICAVCGAWLAVDLIVTKFRCNANWVAIASVYAFTFKSSSMKQSIAVQGARIDKYNYYQASMAKLFLLFGCIIYNYECPANIYEAIIRIHFSECTLIYSMNIIVIILFFDWIELVRLRSI